jgi:transcriptional regulator
VSVGRYVVQAVAGEAPALWPEEEAGGGTLQDARLHLRRDPQLDEPPVCCHIHSPARHRPHDPAKSKCLELRIAKVYVEAASMEMNSTKSEMPQGTLDMVILQVVAAGPIHGYALAQRIRLISRDLLQIQQGSLYPALHRLENREFLAAEWNESETGRDAKFYRLTPRGRAQLRKETAAWARLSEAIALILQRV